MSAPLPNVYFSEDVAKKFGMSLVTLWRLRRDGTFPVAPIKIPGRPRWRISDIDNFLANQPPARQPLFGKSWGNRKKAS